MNDEAIRERDTLTFSTRTTTNYAPILHRNHSQLIHRTFLVELDIDFYDSGTSHSMTIANHKLYLNSVYNC